MEDWSEMLSIDLGNNCFLKWLKPENLKSLRNLYKKLHEVLKKNGHETFMHWRTKDELWKLLHNSWEKQKRFVWLFDEKKNLFGTSFIQICTKDNQEVLNSEFPDSPIDFFKENDNVKIAIFGGDWIDPDQRGKGRNRTMVEKKCELAKQNWCDYVVSIIDVRNKQNLSPYLKNGFMFYGFWKDPSDGGGIIYLVRNLKWHISGRIQPIIPNTKYYHQPHITIWNLLNNNHASLTLTQAA